MNTYILRWNPAHSSYKIDRHLEIISHIDRGEYPSFFNWSIFEWEKLKAGDIFILLQVGTDCDGIAMVGKFSSPPYEAESWRNNGEKIHYADMSILDAFNLMDEIGLLALNFEEEFPEIDWHSGHSGTLVPKNVAKKLIECLVAVMMRRGRWNENAKKYFGLVHDKKPKIIKTRVHSFALRALKQIDSKNKSFYHWGEEAENLGFEMDFGDSLCEFFPFAMDSHTELEKVIGEIDDIALLGSAIYGKWRYTTYWQLGFAMSDDEKAWFRIALERLAELSA